VKDFAARDKRIIPFKRSPVIYNDHCDRTSFAFQGLFFRPGGWIPKIDADPITPPDFVKQRLRPLETAV
jgi:hypothetical protein